MPKSQPTTTKPLSLADREKILQTLKSRFEENMHRHKNLDWSKIQSKLEAAPEKLWSLHEMEKTAGEPDVISLDKKTGEYLFVDCAPESPAARRSLCYDREAWQSRKEARPANNALDLAIGMAVELLTEEEYRHLQTLGEFDLKTSSWIQTPPEIRNLGGALFCDRRYNHVFTYHNGAQSYYAARGFRAKLKL
jgi:hypothetical protein